MAETGVTVLVVGAGPFQVPAIQRARTRGCRVVAVDRNPGAVGLGLADLPVPIDTTDVDGVLELARSENAAAVLTVGSDLALPAVSAVARELGLPGPSPRAVELARNKAAEWELFRELGGAAREMVTVGSPLDVGRTSALSFPVVVKPMDGAGGRGSRFVLSPAGLPEAAELALESSRVKEALIEEFVEGSDHTAELFLVGGEGRFAVITDKELGPPGLVTKRHVVPTALSAEEQVAVWELIDRVCRRVGIGEGPLDIDFRMTPRGPELFELTPRLGGNWVPQLLQRSTGIDLVDWALDLALGKPPAPQVVEVRPVAVELLFSPGSGVVEELPWDQAAQGSAEEVVWLVATGDEVRVPAASADQVGYVIAGGATAREARSSASRVAASCLAGLRICT